MHRAGNLPALVPHRNAEVDSGVVMTGLNLVLVAPRAALAAVAGMVTSQAPQYGNLLGTGYCLEVARRRANVPRISNSLTHEPSSES